MRWRLSVYVLAIAAGCGASTSGGIGPDGSTDQLDDGGGGDGGSGRDDGGGGPDGGGGGGGPDGGSAGGSDAGGGVGSDGGSGSDGGGGGSSTSQLCGGHAWNAAVPASGTTMMAYGTKAYLFGTPTTWTIIENGAASTGAIPLPAGVTAMQNVVAEMAPSGRPLITFTSDNQHWGAFFDGTSFVGVRALGAVYSVNAAHADASERIYTYGTNGLTEHALGASPIVRGAFPIDSSKTKTWGVAADGTVYVVYDTTRPSTIHVGDQANALMVTRLRHGSLSWGEDAEIGSNEGWGFSTVRFAAAPDGSLHVAYVPLGIYFRSHDGTSWVTEDLISFHEDATLVDPVTGSIAEEVRDVKGNLYMLAAQDYDHVAAVFTYNGGSFSYPSYYYLRRCPPFDPTFPAWPAERLAMSGTAWAPTPVAVNERGMASILTPYGVRQDVAQ